LGYARVAGGVDDSDGNHAPAGQKIDGGPSVLHDAVICSPPSTARPRWPPSPRFEAAGLGGLTDDGFVSLDEHSGRLRRPLRPAALLGTPGRMVKAAAD
jgi:hypothetical protein